MSEFDLIVIGAGPGGYVGAIKAAQLGLKVACVEKRDTLGGTCLNVGCIPSKALLCSSEKFEDTIKHASEHGIVTGKVSLDLKAMLKRKDDVVSGLTKGIDGLFAKNKVTRIKGAAVITGANQVTVGKDVYTARNIMIATGSEVATLPNVEIDEKTIVSSTGALNLDKVPSKMVVIGGGVIGLELGSVWRRLGADVEVIEYLDRILPGMDDECAKAFQKILEKQGIKFRLGAKVTAAKKGKGVELSVEPAVGGKVETVKADIVLVAVGRKPHTDGLGLEKVGIKLDERGRIPVDKHYRTSVPSIYAIGDVIVGPMLAHKAEEEGIAAVEIIAGQHGHVNYDAIPGVVYTHPEFATVGKTEEQLKAAGANYKVSKFPFLANSRARANGDAEGFVKMLVDAKTDKVYGVHIIGPSAGTLIAEATLALEYGASSEDIARTCHSHPDLNEAVKEAALGGFAKPIHM